MSRQNNGGHCASPYLRRIPLPKLGTIRSNYICDDDDDDEWIEVQMAKQDLIAIRMRELKARLEEVKKSNAVNNNVEQSHHLNQQQQEHPHDIDDNNCLANGEKDDEWQREETQTRVKCVPFFHPKQLFATGEISSASSFNNTNNK